MPALKPQNTRDPRYIVMAESERRIADHNEAVRQAELAAKRGASAFLVYGPGGRQAQPTPAVSSKPTPVVMSRNDVADLSAQRLAAEALKAGEEIKRELEAEGVPVQRIKPEVSRPFEDQKLVHLCETKVAGIPYVRNGVKGTLMIHMTNFDSGTPYVTPKGLHYKGVEAKRDTTKERPVFRVHGVQNDANGRPVRIDPNFTNNGHAWKAENVDALIYACLKSAGKDADGWKRKRDMKRAGIEPRPAAEAKAERRPIPQPKGRPNDPRYRNGQQPTSGMRM